MYVAFGGGVGRFGTNFTVFHYNNLTVWVDVGSGFSNHDTPGMERNLPNRQLLLAFKPNAIFLTHGHEDHIGALPHCYDIIPEGTPIFASAFTTALVKNRMIDRGYNPDKWNFTLIESNVKIAFDAFEIHTFFMPHSIPQCFSVALQYAGKKAYFSSDFKMNGEEVRHSVSELKKFSPVDFLFVDSTGALNPGETTDEREVAKSLESIISKAKGRIFLTTFSSQVERIKKLVASAKRYGYEIGFVGMSLKSQWQAAFQSGEVHTPVQQMRTPGYKSPKTLWLVAGCQADRASSFYRLTHDELPKIKLNREDTLIYSASMIPGNEGRIYECLNFAADKGVQIIGLSSDDPRVHASGHGRQGDIDKLVSLLRPKTIVPVHGDPLHFHAFTNFIEKKKHRLAIVHEHAIYELGEELTLVENVPHETCLVENGEVHFDQDLYARRVIMSESGICNVIMDKAGFKLIELNYVGAMSKTLNDAILQSLKNSVAQIANEARELPMQRREKRLLDRVLDLNKDILRKKPFVNIIYTPE